MKVSVSIVTYNHEDFIGPCLDSILSQEVEFDYEIVVGEDCSTDRTRAVLLDYEARHPGVIRLLLHEKNVGVNRNFQMVLDACRGEYIAHLDGDDLMLPGKLAKQVAFLDRHPDHVMVAHNMRVFESSTGRTLGSFGQPGAVRPSTELEDLVRYGTYFCNSSKTYRRAALPQGGIDRSTNYVIDWLLHIQTARHGRIGYLDEVLGEYRRHTGGTTAFDISKKHLVFNDQLYTLEKAREYGVGEKTLAYGYARLHLEHALQYLQARRYREFAETMEKSVADGVYCNSKHRICHRLSRYPKVVYGVHRALKTMKQEKIFRIFEH